MAIHFKDLREVLNILRDVKVYIYTMHKSDVLGARILTRVDRVLKDNEDKDISGDVN